MSEVEARHSQIAPAESAEPARLVVLKFCVDPEWKHSIISMWIIKDRQNVKINSYGSLPDVELRDFLGKKA